jgi:lipoprotein-anchoring transpeptidase ErfK/SrfK
VGIAVAGMPIGVNAHRHIGIAALATFAATSLITPPAIAKVGRGPARPLHPARSETAGETHMIVAQTSGAVVRSAPGGRIVGRLAGRTPLGTPTWLWAIAETRDQRWARVVLPWTPNGRTGWVWLPGHRIIHTRTWVQADLSRRRLMLMHGTHTEHTFAAAIGAPDSPTPTGRFSVTDPIATGNPNGPFGWYAFGLSGHQPHLPPGWTGGDQLAIHGTNDPTTLGDAISAGCLHVSATALATLKRALRPGTPVIIHP